MKTIKLSKKDIYYGNLILINKDNPIRIKEREIVENLVPVANSKHLLNKEAAILIHEILDKINTNKDIVPVSGFRSRREQEAIYNDSVIENGLDFTRKFVARPDESEHQSGLALDLGENKDDIDFICPDFPYYGVFNEFRRIALAKGFIERYKEDKEAITGISKEPWHFRYIGYPHSVIMEEKGLCLEEYHGFLKNFTSMDDSYEYRDDRYIWKIFYKEAKDDLVYIKVHKDYDYEISGNNRDGFIICQWKVLE